VTFPLTADLFFCAEFFEPLFSPLRALSSSLLCERFGVFFLPFGTLGRPFFESALCVTASLPFSIPFHNSLGDLPFVFPPLVAFTLNSFPFEVLCWINAEIRPFALIPNEGLSSPSKAPLSFDMILGLSPPPRRRSLWHLCFQKGGYLLLATPFSFSFPSAGFSFATPLPCLCFFSPRPSPNVLRNFPNPSAVVCSSEVNPSPTHASLFFPPS